MTSSEERCPTCDGTGLVSRNDQRTPCPTCSPAGNGSAPYLAPNESDRSGAVRIVRSAAYVVGAAAVLAMLALLIKVLWH
jgi:hypothetical protein